jgi:spoIIIJ-associated protein
MPIEKLRYDVVSAGSSGIFGLVGVKNARIRITNGPREEGGRARHVPEEDRQEIQSMLDEAFADPKKEPREPKEPKETREPRAKAKAKARRPEKTQARPERPRREPRPAAVPEQKLPAEAVSEPEIVSEAQREEEEGPVEEKAPEKAGVEVQEADVSLAREILCRILENITDEAMVKVSCGKDQAFFSVEGGNTSVLIGKRGKTLKAMQHIVEKVVKKAMGDSVEVRVDVENYLEKRETSLKSLASKLAEKARQTGKPTTISRMDSYERKIIHDALRTDRSVKTRSVGAGDFRNVVIHPGGKKTQRKKTVR